MESLDWMNSEHMTGTTIMAVEFDGGVVVGADSRTSAGVYIVNRITDKLTRVTEHIYCCRSGSSADTQAITDAVSYQLDMLQMELCEPPTVKIAANAFKQLCYNYRDSLSAGIICAGWDKRKGGQVYIIPLGGMIKRLPIAVGGSGSTYIHGFIDSNFKTGMTKDECVKFVIQAISLAMARDGSSGGLIRIGIITEPGVERRVIMQDDFPAHFRGY